MLRSCRALTAQTAPGRLARTVRISPAGVVAAAAVRVSGWLHVFPGNPVVGLLHTFPPLRRRIPAGLSLRLAFASLHDDRVEVRHHFFLDAGDAAAYAAH